MLYRFGRENGNISIIGVSTGRSRDYIGITEKKLDAAILFRGIYIHTGVI